MSDQRTVRVYWDFTESHEALIPVDELARAIGVDPAEFTPSMLTGQTTTEELVILLGRYQDEDSYQHSDTRQITEAQPGPPPPTPAALAEQVLDTDHASPSITHDGTLPAQDRHGSTRAAQHHPERVNLAIPADRHAELVRLLHRHAEYWLDEAERLDLEAERIPAVRSTAEASAQWCREQAAATLTLREWIYQAGGPRLAVDTIRTAGGAFVRVFAGAGSLAEWHCLGCLHTAVENPSVPIAREVAARHAEACHHRPVSNDTAYRESAARPAHDFWRCICGNEPTTSGFTPCNRQGLPVEPTADGGWDGLLHLCVECGRIIETGAAIVLDRVATPPTPTSDEPQ